MNTKPLKTKTEWVWWSWGVKQKRWCRSCWDGPTKKAALKIRQEPLASELDYYDNVLVKEVSTFSISLVQPATKGIYARTKQSKVRK